MIKMKNYQHFNTLFRIYFMKITSSAFFAVCCFVASPIAISQNTQTSEEAIQINKLRSLASNYQKDKKYQESIIIFQSLTKVQPENLTLRLDLALSYYYNQNFQLAKNQIDFVIAHPNFKSAPQIVVKNVNKLYKSINEKLTAGNYKDPTFPSNKKTWDAFISLTGSGKYYNLYCFTGSVKNISTLIDDIEANEQIVKKETALALSAHVFANYKIIKPIENWRLDQNISIYQLGESLESSESLNTFSNINYNIGYKTIEF